MGLISRNRFASLPDILNVLSEMVLRGLKRIQQNQLLVRASLEIWHAALTFQEVELAWLRWHQIAIAQFAPILYLSWVQIPEQYVCSQCVLFGCLVRLI